MTREKKKVRSVGGSKFVPVRTEKKASAAKAEYTARKQENLARKKKQKSLLEKQREAELEAKNGSSGKGKKRKPRLKSSPEAVAERSKKLIEEAREKDSD